MASRSACCPAAEAQSDGPLCRSADGQRCSLQPKSDLLEAQVLDAELQGAGILQLIAEVAVALAGFSGVVVALGRRSGGAWASSDKTRLRTMLDLSFLAAFLAIMPFILFHGGLESSSIWAWSSGLGALVMGVRLIRALPQLASIWRDSSVSRPLVATMRSLQAAIVLVLAANATGFGLGQSFTPYLIALVGLLAMSALMFVRLLNVEQIGTQQEHEADVE
jgi:hypothetical protein